MQTYYLKATDEQALWTALETAGLAYKHYDPEDPLNSRPSDLDPDTDWDGPSGAYSWVSKVNGLDVIGIMSRQTGNTITDSNGLEAAETEAISGYHANLRANLTSTQEEALPIIDAPSTPYQKWAGDE
jgi:hypothetical protein